MELRISGLAQVQERLKNAPSLLVSRAFHQALDRAAGVIAAEVEMRTPEGEEGLLKENVIVVVDVEAGAKGGSAAVGFNHVQSERTGKPADLIAFWVEYGHRMVAHDRKTVLGQVQPRPFMRQAAQASGDQAIEVFQDTLIERLSVIEG